MDYMTLKDAAEKWGVTPRRVNYYCIEALLENKPFSVATMLEQLGNKN